MKKLGLLTLGAALGAGTQAATISYDFTSDQAATDFDYTGRLGLFDSTLGTLTGVTLEVYGEFTTALAIGNTGKNAMRQARVWSDFSMHFSSSLAALDALLTETQEEAPWVRWSMDTGKVQLAPYQTLSWAPVTESGSGFIDAGGLLSSFAAAGGGGFDLSCSTSTLTTVTMGGNGWFNQATTGACYAMVTYTYDEAAPYTPPTQDSLGGGLPRPVPEPPSLAVLGLGLAYMAARGRSRQPAAA